MEIQVSFPGLEAWLSYESVDDVSVGDHVRILEGTRRGMVGTVEALRRGSFTGELCTCEKTDEETDALGPWEQNFIVKSRLGEEDVVARQTKENQLQGKEAISAPAESMPAKTSPVPPRGEVSPDEVQMSPKNDGAYTVIGVNLAERKWDVNPMILDRFREMFGDHMLPGRGFWFPVHFRLVFEADLGLGRAENISQADRAAEALESVLLQAVSSTGETDGGFEIVSVASGWCVVDAADDVYMQMLGLQPLTIAQLPDLLTSGLGGQRPAIADDPCTECQGTGYQGQDLCPDCNGVGSMHIVRLLETPGYDLYRDPYPPETVPVCEHCGPVDSADEHLADHGLCSNCRGYRDIEADRISESPSYPCYACGAMGTRESQERRAAALDAYWTRLR